MTRALLLSLFFHFYLYLQRENIMGQPKRKQSKARSRKRRGANRFTKPELAKDPTDGTTFRPHRVNPANGLYRGRQVIEVDQ